MSNKILVVDDNAMNLKMAEMILKQKQYEVLKAESGQECIEILKKDSVDLILLDIEMPVMNGFETMEQIKQLPGLSEIPVAFLSANDDEEIIEKAKSYGAADYVKKPFIPADLQSRVANMLNN